MIHGDIAGLEQPVGTGKFAVNVLEYQDQTLIALNQQVVYKQFFIDGTYDVACFCGGLLIKIITIKNLGVKSKSTQRIVPQHFIKRYGTVFQSHTIPSGCSA